LRYVTASPVTDAKRNGLTVAPRADVEGSIGMPNLIPVGSRRIEKGQRPPVIVNGPFAWLFRAD
jgi:hypothetical protein